MTSITYDTELPDEVTESLMKADKDREIRLLRLATEENVKFLDFVRNKVKGAERFWPVTLLSHPTMMVAASAAADKEALMYMTDVEVVQDVKDPRAYELVFHFKENPYFTNTKLVKKYSLPEGAKPAPADGSINDELRAFEMDDLVPGSMTIDWKPDHDLTAKHPRRLSEDGDFEGDIGSFFHLFTEADDPIGLGAVLIDVMYDPLNTYDQEGDSDEEDEDDEGSIDLGDDEEDDEAGEPQRKKQKV